MRNYPEAEQELLGLFSSSLGVRGQCYDPDKSGTFDVNALHLALRQSRHRKELSSLMAFGVTFAACHDSSRLTLWHAFDPSRPVNDWLCASFKSPRNARLAPYCAAAHAAYEKQFKRSDITRAEMTEYLEKEAKSEQPNQRLRDAIQRETDRVLDTALAEYDAHRLVRVAGEKQGRAKYYEELWASLKGSPS